MSVAQWLGTLPDVGALEFVAGLVALHAAWTLYRLLAADPDAAEHADADAGTVACPTCGAENDVEYRFCRACVEELPGSSPAGGIVGDGATGSPD